MEGIPMFSSANRGGGRRILTAALAIATAFSLTACGEPSGGAGSDRQTVRIGVVGDSNEVWEPIIDKLGKDGLASCGRAWLEVGWSR